MPRDCPPFLKEQTNLRVPVPWAPYNAAKTVSRKLCVSVIVGYAETEDKICRHLVDFTETIRQTREAGVLP